MEPLNWYKVIFWWCGSILFIGLTIIDIVPLIRQFKFNNIDVQMNVSSANGPITPPQLVLFIPHSDKPLRNVAAKLHKFDKTDIYNCNECEKLANRSWDVWSSMNFTDTMTVENYYNILSASLSKKLLIDGSADDFAVLNTSNLGWNLPILGAAWDLIGCILSMDALINFGKDWKWERCYGMHDLDFAISTTKMNKLFNRIIDILCAFIQFQQSPWHTCKQNLENSLGVLFPAGYLIEIPMLPNGSIIEFKSISENVQWPAMDGNSSRQFSITQNLEKIVWPGPLVEKADSGSVSTSDNSARSGINCPFIAYSTVFTLTDKRKNSPCFIESSAAICLGNCMLGKIVHECGCIPFSFRKHKPCWNQQLPYCNTTMYYSDCKLNKSKAEIDCQSKCIHPCKHIRYQWQVTNKNVFPDVRSVKFTIRPSTEPTPLVEFSMAEKYTFEQFLAQMASFFNLYLGVSGLQLVAWSILIIEYFLLWYRARKDCNKIDGQNGTGSHELRGVPCIGCASGIQSLEVTLQQVVNSQGVILEEMKSMKQRLDAIEGQLNE